MGWRSSGNRNYELQVIWLGISGNTIGGDWQWASAKTSPDQMGHRIAEIWTDTV